MIKIVSAIRRVHYSEVYSLKSSEKVLYWEVSVRGGFTVYYYCNTIIIADDLENGSAFYITAPTTHLLNHPIKPNNEPGQMAAVGERLNYKECYFFNIQVYGQSTYNR